MFKAKLILSALAVSLICLQNVGAQTPPPATPTRLATVAALQIASLDADKKPYIATITAADTARKLAEEIYLISGKPSPPNAEVAAVVQRTWDKVRAAANAGGAPAVLIDDCAETTAEFLPQGVLRICKGLLSELRTEDQLAAVMGHELAHAIYDDGGFQRYNGATAYAVELLTAAGYAAGIVATGGASAAIFGGAIAAQAPVALQSSWFGRYLRDQEERADRLGVDLAVKAGYRPDGMSDFMTGVLGATCDAASRSAFDSAASAPPAKRKPRGDTHPDPGRRACAMDDYIEAHYGDLNDKRRRTPTPWALKDGSGARVRPATVSGRYFADLDQSFAVARELAASAPPEGVAPPAACAKARAAAKVMAARYPKDLDYRRFSGAVEVRCGSPRAAFDALLPDTRDPGFVRRDGLQATALALLAGARSDAATIFRSTFNADWTLATEAEIARDKARFDRQTTITGAFGAAIGAQVGVGSVRPEMLRRYNTLPCTLDSTELKQTYEGICNELFGGTSAAFTCKPDTYIIDIRTSRLAGRNIYNCPTGRLGDRALSIGPLEYLREESPWYRAVAGVATWEERLARAEQEQKAAQAARKGN